MKQFLLAALMLLYSTCFSQNYEQSCIHDSIFTTVATDLYGDQVGVSFVITPDDQLAIYDTELFNIWQKDYLQDTSFVLYYLHSKSQLELYLAKKVYDAFLVTEIQLKSGYAFILIDGTIGLIQVHTFDDIRIEFPFVVSFNDMIFNFNALIRFNYNNNGTIIKTLIY